MIFSIIFDPKALEEYREASIWYEVQQEGLGIRFEATVENTIAIILDKCPKRTGLYFGYIPHSQGPEREI